MLLTKTKIQFEAYSHNSLVYDVPCSMERLSRSVGVQVSVRMLARDRPVRWGIESMRYHRMNVVSCEIFTGLAFIPIVGTYLPHLTLEHLTDLEEVLQRFRDPIFLCDFNLYLEKARSLWSQRLSELLTE